MEAQLASCALLASMNAVAGQELGTAGDTAAALASFARGLNLRQEPLREALQQLPLLHHQLLQLQQVVEQLDAASLELLQQCGLAEERGSRAGGLFKRLFSRGSS
jgi:hypothetical protein